MAVVKILRRRRRHGLSLRLRAGCHKRYNQTMALIGEEEKKGHAFVIRPREALSIGRPEKNPENIRRVYNIGKRDGLVALRDLLKWKNQLQP